MDKYELLHYSNICVTLAQESPDDIKTGCVIVKNSVIIGRGYNQPPAFWGSRPLTNETGNTLPIMNHAEDVALDMITKSNCNSLNADLICTVSPCQRCAIRIIGAGIKNVHYVLKFWKQPEADYALWLLESAGIGINVIEV